MNYLKIILKQSKKRLIFTLIGFIISGMVLVFSIFYTAAIKNNLSKNIKLNPHEYHLFVDENRFENIPKNYYLELSNNFERVIPFNTYELYEETSRFLIIGTELDTNKLLLNNNFYDIHVTQTDFEHLNYPKVYVYEKNYHESLDLLEFNNHSFAVIGYFDSPLLDNQIPEDTIMLYMDIEDYATYVDSSIVNTNSGISKYIINHYYIYSEYNEALTIFKLQTIYNDPFIRSFLYSHESLLNTMMADFMVFSNVALIFFILVSIFSFVNILVAINLTIIERSKFYVILSMLGMNMTTLKLLILLEIAGLSIIASILSLLLGLIASYVTINFIGIAFVSVPVSTILLVLCVIWIVPILHAMIVVQSIKYKNVSKISLA